MTKFEEEVKRPKKAYIDPFSKRDVDFTGVAKKFTEAAQTLKEWKEYAFLHEDKLKLQQQSLPVVPERVAGAIESIPDHYSAFEAIDLIKSKVEVFTEENKDWLQVYNWLCEGIDNQDTFALAFITRKYQVEKPQLFYIDLPKVFGLSDSTSDSTFVSKAESGIISEFTKGKDYALKLTEQEIKSIDERYWQFAVPVEDGE